MILKFCHLADENAGSKTFKQFPQSHIDEAAVKPRSPGLCSKPADIFNRNFASTINELMLKHGRDQSMYLVKRKILF